MPRAGNGSRACGSAGNFIGQELQGDEAVQTSVLGLVHYAHAAAAELFDDAVVRDGLADHESRYVRRAARASQ